LLGSAFSPCSNLATTVSYDVVNVMFTEWGASTASSNGLQIGNGFNHLYNVQSYAFGGTSACISSGGPNLLTGVICGQSAGVGGAGSALLVQSPTQSANSTFVAGNSQNATVVEVQSGGLWQSTGDQVINQTGNSAASDEIKIDSGATAYITNMLNLNGGAFSNGLETVGTAKLWLAGYHHTGASPNKSVTNAGTLFDGGNNSYTGPITSTGTWSGVTNSATGTTCTTGNFALTSGWGASSVTSVTANGDTRGCHVTITGAAGAASPVLTWTYPSVPPVAPPSCHIVGVSGTLTGVVVGTPGATTVAFTFAGTPSAQTYVFDVGCP
jgi:hypothetical protein